MNYIETGGKKLPIYFGLRAISEFSKNIKTEFSEVLDPQNSLTTIDSVVSIAVMGLNDGSRREGGSATKYTEGDVWDLIDADVSLISKVTEIFMESVTPMIEKLGIEVKNENRPAER